MELNKSTNLNLSFENSENTNVPCECHTSSTCELRQELNLIPEMGTSSEHSVDLPSNVDGATLSRPITSSNTLPVGRITVDAVHPFFTSYRNIKCDKSTSTDNQQFYCRECNVYFDLCQEAVSQHFSIIHHTSSEMCIYCKTAVYSYFYNENQYFYHRCIQ